MYKQGYVLVNIGEFYTLSQKDGKKTVSSQKLLIPEGKKPLVLSIDDLSYYKHTRENGVVHKLVIDEKGELAAWTANTSGGELSYDLDVVTILEDFIKHYPDFSLRGSRGIIALTGYEGILGYQTQNVQSPDYPEEAANAAAVVKKLKELGWRFASHGWGHQNMRSISLAAFRNDTERWDKEVRPLTGDTDLYIYPFGAKIEALEDRHKILRERNFTIFFGVGSGYGLIEKPDYIYMDRKNIDGVYFESYKNRADKLFDIEKVINKESRKAR